jgi:hypothetical protein
MHSGGVASAGGFALEVSNGTLAVPEGASDVLVMGASDQWATHTRDGSGQRQWRLLWTAPDPVLGDATFYLAVLSADGDGFHDDEDAWNMAAFIIRSPAPPSDDDGSGEGPARTIPLNAYWFGVIAFIATLMIVWVAFLVLKDEAGKDGGPGGRKG